LVYCAGFIVSSFLILSLKNMFLILRNFYKFSNVQCKCSNYSTLMWNFYGMLVSIINYVSRG